MKLICSDCGQEGAPIFISVPSLITRCGADGNIERDVFNGSRIHKRLNLSSRQTSCIGLDQTQGVIVFVDLWIMMIFEIVRTDLDDDGNLLIKLGIGGEVGHLFPQHSGKFVAVLSQRILGAWLT